MLEALLNWNRIMFSPKVLLNHSKYKNDHEKFLKMVGDLIIKLVNTINGLK